MIKKSLPIVLTTMMGIMILIPTDASAITNKQIQEKKTELSKVKGNQTEVKKNITQSADKIEQLRVAQQKVDKEIEMLDVKIADTSGKEREKQKNIDTTKKNIADIERQITDVSERMSKRNEVLMERARSLQESGGAISYLDVLLGAQNFTDFVNRIDAVSTLFDADKTILEEQQSDKELKQHAEEDLQTNLANLENDLQDLKLLQEQLELQSAAKEKLMASLEKQEKAEEERKMDLQEEKELYDKQKQALSSEIQQLLETQRREREAKNVASSGGGSLPAITSGSFMRPANGPITSGFGARWGKSHDGVDIGKRGSSVPIVAAADGYVFRAYYSSSYGNVVFLTHNIDGQLWTTVYGHMESSSVSEGQTVEKGQQIGYMGNTGHSFGAHLHFELHKGQWNASKSNAVDPRSYVPF